MGRVRRYIGSGQEVFLVGSGGISGRIRRFFNIMGEVRSGQVGNTLTRPDPRHITRPVKWLIYSPRHLYVRHLYIILLDTCYGSGAPFFFLILLI